MKKLFLTISALAALSLLASAIGYSTAFAVIDPDENSMGLYWDLTADTVCIPPSSGVTDLYLILTNPTMEAIGGFEAAFDMEAVVAPYILSATYANNPWGCGEWGGLH